jgi:hypothetical protein
MSSFVDAGSAISRSFSQLNLISPDSDCRRRLAENLRDHGYAIVRLDAIEDHEAGYHAIKNWETIFKQAFDSLNGRDSILASSAISRYRAEKGMTLGYRKDDEHREFLETRRGFEPGMLDPSFSCVKGHDETTLTLFKILGEIGEIAISCMSELMVCLYILKVHVSIYNIAILHIFCRESTRNFSLT